MMHMVEEITRRLDTLPPGSDHVHQAVEVPCATCPRGVSLPLPLFQLMIDAATAGRADSAIRLYRALRARYYGRDAYDFGEGSLNTAAFRLGRAKRFDDAFALLRLNEDLFPRSPGLSVFRGDIQIMNGDKAAGSAEFREAIRRDSTNVEARGRLQRIGRAP